MHILTEKYIQKTIPWLTLKMQTLHFYNGIYFAWEKTHVPPNAGCEIQLFVGMLSL